MSYRCNAATSTGSDAFLARASVSAFEDHLLFPMVRPLYVIAAML